MKHKKITFVIGKKKKKNQDDRNGREKNLTFGQQF